MIARELAEALPESPLPVWGQHLSGFSAEGLLWLREQAPDAPEAVLLAAALVLQAAEEGHACLYLPPWAASRVWGETLPALAHWQQQLAASPLVAAPGSYAPLVLVDDRLYLARLWQDEQRLAQALRQRSGPSRLPARLIEAALAQVFPGSAENDAQRQAARLALSRQLCCIAGGPGTGKTRTVARVLAAALTIDPQLRIQLAAPTGKAAARMLESLQQAQAGLALDLLAAAAMPRQASTLHRLLGIRPERATPRHHAGNPLALDWLVVDEASMIDLPLFARLLDALPPHAGLILLGDPDQLAAVGPGAVFADLTRPTHGPLAASIARLHTSHRFGGESGIAALAQAANAGDAPECQRLLTADSLDLYGNSGPAEARLPALLARLDAALQPYHAAIARQDASAALQALNQCRVLCAVREGPMGVVHLNSLLTRRFQPRPAEAFYPGHAVLIRSNDPALGLSNGDVGVCVHTAQGLRVMFGEPGTLRAIAPHRLPAHDPAFAMTVHQAQGSEFPEVILLLPDEDSPVLTRSLVYTAITRAQNRFELWGQPGILAAALARPGLRKSGLATYWG